MLEEDEEPSVEALQQQLGLAAKSFMATLPGDEFRAIFKLAQRSEIYAIGGLDYLEAAVGYDEVALTGKEIIAILMLALEAKLKGLPPRLCAVPTKH